MKEHYVSYEQAKRLKALGFNWECYYHYDTTANKPKICPNYTNNDGEGDLWIYSDDCNLYCDMNSHQYCSAPSLNQVQAWLREVKEWDVIAIPTLSKDGSKKYRWDICHWSNPEYGDDSKGIYESYELALNAGIDAVLKLLEKGESQ